MKDLHQPSRRSNSLRREVSFFPLPLTLQIRLIFDCNLSLFIARSVVPTWSVHRSLLRCICSYFILLVLALGPRVGQRPRLLTAAATLAKTGKAGALSSRGVPTRTGNLFLCAAAIESPCFRGGTSEIATDRHRDGNMRVIHANHLSGSMSDPPLFPPPCSPCFASRHGSSSPCLDDEVAADVTCWHFIVLKIATSRC